MSNPSNLVRAAFLNNPSAPSANQNVQLNMNDLLIAKARRSCYSLVRPFPTLSCFHFFTNFLELIFATKLKTILLKQSAVLFTSCQKNIAYIMCLDT